jgi:hypothetical protein
MNLSPCAAPVEPGSSAVVESVTGDTSAPDAGSAASSPRLAEASPEAKRLAAAVLEVLAGTRGPGEAAAALGISLPRYYQLEGRALAGLLAACEPRRGGRKGRSGNELAGLRQECDRLRRECARQHALVRAAQRTVGLAPPTPPPPPRPAEGGRKRRRRRPKARALKVVAMLRDKAGTAPTANPQPGSTEGADGSQPSEVASGV